MQSLQNISLDTIIFSKDYEVILQLPKKILKMIDERERELCETKKYKQHFLSNNVVEVSYEEESYEEESYDEEESYMYDGERYYYDDEESF